MRADLPTGTVTFLLTDVEGSTRLLDEFGAERYAEALAAHREIVREGARRHGGVEVDTQGDAFFVAFGTAPDAVAAAGWIREHLAESRLRVRCGVHTGTPIVTGEGYVGADVHRAARIAASGHGGQVLVSAATAALVDLLLRDLGEHRFKDLAAPERVFQLGDAEFPPIRSLYRSNLPVPATAFLGRERELAEVVELLSREQVQLITLTGPGGTGKTRLALQAAAEVSDAFPDGVWWVPLAPLRDPALVLSSVAHALEVKDQPGRELAETLADHVSGKRLLVLLDNAEHLLPDLASVLARLRDAIPTLALIVTSRERLQLSGEEVWPVPSLAEQEGVELFLARAASFGAARPDGSALTELCARLDNLPLALELAAARAVVFTPEQLLERLGQRLDLLKGGRDADPRQQTLRATIDWSYQLLDENEQRVLRGLSVFAGGCTYDAVERVVGADPDALQSLLDKSLLRRRDSDLGARYWMLETIREYAAEQLVDRSGDAVQLAHAEYFASLAVQADPHLRHGPDQRQWVERVTADFDNIRVAMRFALVAAPGLALQIVGSLAFFLWLGAHFAEARTWVEDALEAGAGEPIGLRAKAFECGAIAAERLGDLEAGARYSESAYDAYEAAGDALGKASALRELGKSAIARGELERARSIYEGLVRYADEVGDPWNGAIALNNLGDLALYDGDFERTLELCGRSRELRLGLGDRWGAAWALLNVVLAQLRLDRLGEARRNLRTALDESLEMGSTIGVSAGLDLAALVAAATADWPSTARLLGASERLGDELGTIREGYESAQRAQSEREALAILGEQGYAAEWERGHGLSLEEAVAGAFSTSDSLD